MTTRRFGWASALVAVFFAAVAVSAGAGTPGADLDNGTWVGGVSVASERLVLWNLPGTNGVRGTCIDANLAGPLHGPYTVQTTIVDPIYAELNHRYAVASTSDARLAELSALNSHKYDRINRATQWSYLAGGVGGTSVADANAMLAAATRLAGPYTVHVTTSVTTAVAGHRYTARVTVTSARGYPVPGARVDLAGTGVTFTHAAVPTDASGRAGAQYTVAQSATDRFTVTASVKSWTHIAIYQAPGEQHMLAVAAPTQQRGSVAGHVVHLRPVELVKVAVGDQNQTPLAGYTFRITDASGHVVIDHVATGPTAADASLGSLQVGRTFTATELGVPTESPLYIPVGPTTTFTVPAGTDPWVVVARDPHIPHPSVITQAEPSGGATAGDRVSDQVLVSGNDGEDGVIDATLYGPAAPPRSGNCSDLSLASYRAAPAQHLRATVDGSVNSGNGDVIVIGPEVSHAGCYGWAERLTLHPSGATVSSPPTAPDESVLVVLPLAPVAPTPSQPVVHLRHIAPSLHTPQLARTGPPVRVRATLAAGLDLIAAGSLVMAVATRRRRAAGRHLR